MPTSARISRSCPVLTRMKTVSERTRLTNLSPRFSIRAPRSQARTRAAGGGGGGSGCIRVGARRYVLSVSGDMGSGRRLGLGLLGGRAQAGHRLADLGGGGGLVGGDVGA